MDELEILDDAALARRWHKDKEGISLEAIAKWIDRRCNRKRAGHLKYFKAGNKRLFRLEDIQEFEARAKSSALSFLQFTDDDLDELDPAADMGKKPNYP